MSLWRPLSTLAVLLLGIGLVVGLFLPGASRGEAALFGDANCDGHVNSIDAAIILQLDAGLVTSVGCPAKADANGDGNVNSIDASLILQYSAGLIQTIGPAATMTPTRTRTPTATPHQPCTYSGPYAFSGSLPSTSLSTSTFCLTAQRAILEWSFANNYVGTLSVDLMDESVHQVAYTSFHAGTGSESMQTAGPGYYFLDIHLYTDISTTQASWTLTIRQ